jgi:hypothetical protein
MFTSPAGGAVDPAFGKHYSPQELTKLWRFNRETVRKLIQFEPGVLKIREGLLKKRTRYSVPEAVARRIYNRLTDKAA